MVIKPGVKVRVAECSGVNSGKTGTVIAWHSATARQMLNEYPFVGRGPEKMRTWVPIVLDGFGEEVTAMPKTRLFTR